jgi:hypothetical protein
MNLLLHHIQNEVKQCLLLLTPSLGVPLSILDKYKNIYKLYVICRANLLAKGASLVADLRAGPGWGITPSRIEGFHLLPAKLGKSYYNHTVSACLYKSSARKRGIAALQTATMSFSRVRGQGGRTVESASSVNKSFSQASPAQIFCRSDLEIWLRAERSGVVEVASSPRTAPRNDLAM